MTNIFLSNTLNQIYEVTFIRYIYISYKISRPLEFEGPVQAHMSLTLIYGSDDVPKAHYRARKTSKATHIHARGIVSMWSKVSPQH